MPLLFWTAVAWEAVRAPVILKLRPVSDANVVVLALSFMVPILIELAPGFSSPNFMKIEGSSLSTL